MTALLLTLLLVFSGPLAIDEPVITTHQEVANALPRQGRLHAPGEDTYSQSATLKNRETIRRILRREMAALPSLEDWRSELNDTVVIFGEITIHQEVEMAVQRWWADQPALWPTFMCIIERESHFNPFARGAAEEVGLAQTHPIHAWAYDWARLLSGDIDYQVAVAHDQWEGAGLWPWRAQKGVCW